MKEFYFFCFVSLVFFSHQVLARSSIDARVEYENWNSGINGKTSALLYGIGVSTALSKSWSLSGGFVTGKHTFDRTDKASANRQDVDFAIAYQLLPKLRVFGGYRLIKLSYENQIDNNRAFTDLTHGLGIGVATFYVVAPKLYVYGRLGTSGLYSSVNFSGVPDDKGYGIGSGFEAGLIYQVVTATNIGLSIKQQTTIIKYKNASDKWNHNYLRFGFNLSRSF